MLLGRGLHYFNRYWEARNHRTEFERPAENILLFKCHFGCVAEPYVTEQFDLSRVAPPGFSSQRRGFQLNLIGLY